MWQIPSHSAVQYENNLKSEIFNTSKQRITNTHINDPDSKFRTYLEINPNLELPLYADNYLRFRTGTHNLLIETWRLTNQDKYQENEDFVHVVNETSHVNGMQHCVKLN